MVETFQFDLVSPESRLSSLQARQVQIPGSEGDITAMPGHMHLITTLRPGILIVTDDDNEKQFVVSGGFAEVGLGLTVLAERAFIRSEITHEDYQVMLGEAEDHYRHAKDTVSVDKGTLDEAEKRLNDMFVLGAEIGFETNR